MGKPLIFGVVLLGGCFGPRHNDPGNRALPAGDMMPRIGSIRLAIHPHWIEDDTSHWTQPGLCVAAIATDRKEHRIALDRVSLGFEETEVTQEIQEPPQVLTGDVPARFSLRFSLGEETEIEDCRRVRLQGTLDDEKFERIYVLP